MKLTINTEILKKYDLTLEEYLVLLTGYYGKDYSRGCDSLLNKGLISPNLFYQTAIVLSDNTKNLIAKIMMESDDKAINSKINFQELAAKLQSIYPAGVKAGKTYSWRGTVEEVAQKLLTLVVKYDFTFTEEEAIAATKEYVSSFQPPYTYMHTLRNFILCTKRDEVGKYEVDSLFMTIIENNRSNES